MGHLERAIKDLFWKMSFVLCSFLIFVHASPTCIILNASVACAAGEGGDRLHRLTTYRKEHPGKRRDDPNLKAGSPLEDEIELVIPFF